MCLFEHAVWPITSHECGSLWCDTYTWNCLKLWHCQVRSASNSLNLSGNVVTGKHSVHLISYKNKHICYKCPRHHNVQKCGDGHTVITCNKCNKLHLLNVNINMSYWRTFPHPHKCYKLFLFSWSTTCQI